MGERIGRHFLVTACIVLGASSSLAWGQDRDDPDLARALAQRGWFDLAEEILDRLEKSPSSSTEARGTISLVKAEILVDKVDRESDVEKSKQYVTEAVGLLKDFIAKNPAHASALEARINIGWLSTRKARILTDAIEIEQSPERHAEMRREAAAIYAEAEKYYQEFIAELEKAKSNDEAAQNARMDARLELCRAMYEHSKISGVDEQTKKKLLGQAIRYLVDFEFDYGDRPIAFEAMLEEGRCMLELGDYKQAEMKLRSTFALKKRLAEAKIRPNEYHNRIIYGAYVATAQLLTRSGKPSAGKAFVEQTLRDDRQAEKDWVGPILKLEMAEACFQMHDMARANQIANELIKQDPNSRPAFLARQKLKSWSTAPGGGLKLSPDQLMSAAEASLERDQFREALVSLRNCVEACTTPQEKEKFQASAFYKMGQCFQQMKRNYEAAMAYENVFRLQPKHELAAKACYEVVRCFNSEFTVSGDKRDDEAKEKYLSLLASNWPKDPAARNIKFVQAEKEEKKGNLKQAADLYMQVLDDAEAYENALVAAGFNYRIDAAKKWEKGSKDAAVQADVKGELKLAEQALRKFLARVADESKKPSQPELLKARATLIVVANQELAYIYMHEAVGRADEALKFLEQVAKDIPPDDERMSKILGTQIQAFLAQKQVDRAVKVLEMMFDRFPDSSAIARASKSVAIKLDEVTTDLIKNKGDQNLIKENLKKISKYYAKWLSLAPSLQMRITMQDVLSVAETLYMIAKQLNGLDENTICFLDLKGKAISEKQYFQDAAFVHTLLTEGRVGKLSDKDRIVLMTRLARCYSFTATDAATWEKAKEQYERILKDYKLINASGSLDDGVLGQHRELLGVYVEQGYVYYELGRRGNKFQFDNASTVFSNVLRVTGAGSEAWWLAKYMVLAVLFDRGNDADIKLARVGLDNLERNSPDFDAGKFGMKEKFQELKKKVLQVTGGK
jgi:hypothetical protein